MKQTLPFLILFFMASYIWRETEASFTNFEVKRFEVCNNTQSQIQYYGHVTKEHGNQYLTHNLTLPFPIGDNIGFVCLIQTKTVGNNFVELYTIRERNICKAFNKYMGEFWYDMQRESQMAPGVCPMQLGRYHGHHIQLHFEKISLQTFPFGTLRFTVHGVDNSNKTIVWCLFFEVDNTVN